MLWLSLVVAAVATGCNDVHSPPVFDLDTPVFRIPVNFSRVKPADAKAVQLYVSDDRGATWKMWDEITPDRGSFTYTAAQPGEYWFQPVVVLKDGSCDPKDVAAEPPQLRVRVKGPKPIEMLAGRVEPLPPLAIPQAPQPAQPCADPLITQPIPYQRVPQRADFPGDRIPPQPGVPSRAPQGWGGTPDRPPTPSPADRADKLDTELTELELQLIESEIRRLRDAGKFDEQTLERIADLRNALQRLKDRVKPAPRSTRSATMSGATYYPSAAPAPILPPQPEAVPPPAPGLPR